VSCACANRVRRHGKRQRGGLRLVKDNPVPGSPGLPSLQKADAAMGYTVLSFEDVYKFTNLKHQRIHEEIEK